MHVSRGGKGDGDAGEKEVSLENNCGGQKPILLFSIGFSSSFCVLFVRFGFVGILFPLSFRFPVYIYTSLPLSSLFHSSKPR